MTTTNWSVAREKCLADAVAKLQELIAKANDPSYLKDITQAVRVLGELQVQASAVEGAIADLPARYSPPDEPRTIVRRAV